LPALISVIIPHLNQADQLQRCLESLARQTWSDDFEIVVVDNGSNALPRDVIAGFPNARLEQEETPGPGPARNRGVSKSRGAILAFTDADCTVDDGWLATIAARLQNPKAKRVLGGDVRIVVGDPKRLTQLEAYESVFAYRQEEYIRKFRFSGTGNLAVRREDFDIIGPFAGINISEDREWGRRAISLGYGIDYVPKMIVYHPARSTFAEIFEKWNRHIVHDYAEYAGTKFETLRWTFYAFGVAFSPPLELRRILASTRLSNFRERCLAFAALVLIRAYRARRMITVATTSKSELSQSFWNRD
jgi:glycosyltransferase involved in cell wall biosynthesis